MENVNAANARHRKKYDDAKNTEWHRQRAIHRRTSNPETQTVDFQMLLVQFGIAQHILNA